jgi:hypothetical protein
MARTQTLAAMRTAVLQRADMANTQFIGTSELTALINSSIAELYDLLLASRQMDYYEKVPPQTITADGRTTGLYDLPTDFYRLIIAEANMGGFTLPLMPFTYMERGRLSQQPIQSGTVVTIRYVPFCPLLVNDSDTFDGFNGWEEYVINDCAAHCQEKEESDAGPFYKRKAELTARIQRMAPDRDMGMPAKRQDVYRTPLSPFVSRPLPQYRIHGTTGISGAVAPQIELLQGLPFGVIF